MSLGKSKWTKFFEFLCVCVLASIGFVKLFYTHNFFSALNFFSFMPSILRAHQLHFFGYIYQSQCYNASPGRIVALFTPTGLLLLQWRRSLAFCRLVTVYESFVTYEMWLTTFFSFIFQTLSAKFHTESYYTYLYEISCKHFCEFYYWM